MAYEITNTLRSSSIIRITGAGTTTIQLANLAYNANETVGSASIKRVNWSTQNAISVARGGNIILNLYRSGEIRLDDWGHSIANNSTGNVVVVIDTTGTIFLEVSKDTTYATALVG